MSFQGQFFRRLLFFEDYCTPTLWFSFLLCMPGYEFNVLPNF